MKRVLACFFACAALLPASSRAQDGAPDPGFGTGAFGPGRVVIAVNRGGTDADIAQAVAVDSRQRVLVAGTSASATDDAIAVVRLLPDGQPDPAFGTAGTALVALPGLGVRAFAMAVQADDQVLVAGDVIQGADHDFFVARLRTNGSLDPAFGNNGYRTVAFNPPAGPVDQALAVALAPDGGIFLAGGAGMTGSFSRMAVARLDPSGNLDPAFGGGNGRVDFAFDGLPAFDRFDAVQVLADGRLLLAGVSSSQGDGVFAVVRLQANGTPDASFGNFGPGRSLVDFDIGGANLDIAFDLALTRSGAIVLAGVSIVDMDTARFSIARLLPDGVLDPGFFGGGRQTVDFSAEGAGYAAGYALAVQSDGAIVIAGSARRPGVGNDFASARLLANGSLDSSYGNSGRQLVGFDAGSSNNDTGYALALANGHVLIAGGVQRSFNAGNDQDFGVARLQLDLLFTDGYE